MNSYHFNENSENKVILVLQKSLGITPKPSPTHNS